MGKIKLNLVSGAVVEKPLINAFKANNNSYIVLDNEMNGSMGLPIILVCKFEQDKLIKIVDQNEWGIVKEYLKNIIAGNKIEFIKVNNELAADDIYYTQLTLPVPSFDALKNAYKVEEIANEDTTNVGIMDVFNNVNTEIQQPIETVSPVEEQPVVEPIPSVNPEPVNMEPIINPVVENVPNMENPVIDIPVASVEPEQPVVESTPVIEPVVAPSPMDIVPPVMPEAEITPTPVIEPTITEIVNETVENQVNNVTNNESIFSEQKEAFMQACENMFDALVQKFQKELENNNK